MQHPDSITHEGVPLKVEIFADDHSPAPWEMSDCHGAVRTARREDKLPNERILGPTGSRDWWYLYDIRDSQERAMREAWQPAALPDEVHTRRTLAAVAVREDFEYLRAWVNGEWHYVGVCVTHIPSGAHVSLWGIDSNDTEYQTTVAHELAKEALNDPVYVAWRERVAQCERAIGVAHNLDCIADVLELRELRSIVHDAAELLRVLARKEVTE